MDEQEKEIINDMLGETPAEEFHADTDTRDIVNRIKELVKKGNIARILVKKGSNVLVNLPLNAGIIGGLIGVAAAPWAMLAAAIATAGFDCEVELVREDGEVVDVSPKSLGKRIIETGNNIVDDFKDAAAGRTAEDADFEETVRKEEESNSNDL